jgi:hypothetical protein
MSTKDKRSFKAFCRKLLGDTTMKKSFTNLTQDFEKVDEIVEAESNKIGDYKLNEETGKSLKQVRRFGVV